MNRQSTRRLLLASSAIASFAAIGIAGVADAQTSTARAGEVVVTGSRIARKDYVADSPIVTVTPKQIENTGLATVEALTNQLPQVVPAATSTSNNPSNSGRANIQLRGIGSQRTLVLLDGRRPTPSDSLGRVDLNTIPAALIENIEVITGGASAAYGSDAVAGVVNFHLKHRFTGVQLDAQYGKTDRNDGAEQQYSITAGGNFADDRGNAVMSFTYGSRDRIYNANRAFSSYSGASSTLPFGNITTAFTRAQTDAIFARYGIAPGTAATNKFAFNSDGTLIGFDPVSGAALNYKGPTTIDYSTLLKGAGSVATGAYNTGPLNDLVIPLERYTAFGRAEYEINRHAKFYGQFMYTDYTTSTELAPAPGSNAPLLAVVTINGNTINSVGGTGFYVPVSNPFIPADLRTLLANRAPVNGVSVANSPFVLNKRTSTFGPRHSEERYNTSNFTTGVTGEIGFKDWTYDVYASYGRMSHLTTQTGNVSHQAVQQLLQAADGGASACAGGYNPFGLQPVSAACQSFVTRTTKNYEDLISRDVEATFQGSLIELPAGTMKFALGADYRRQSYGFVPDAVLSTPDSGSIASGITPCTGTSPPQPTTPTATAQAGCNYTIFAPGVVGFNALSPLKGSIDTYEIFGELFVPILRDLPLIKTLNANLGYRFSDYNLAGSVNSYKIDAEWKPVSWALVRGGYQRAVRAPSIGELFAPQNNNFPSIGSTAPSSTNTNGDPCDARSQWRTNSTFNNAAVRALCLAQGVPASAIDTFRYDSTQVQTLVGGNTNLKSEIADTYSVGVVLTPHFDHPLFRRMSMSVDYYNIKVNHVIGFVGAVTAIDKCYNFQGANPTYSAANAYCSYFVRDPSSGFILTGNSTNQNLGRLNTSGEDIQFDWAFGLGALGMNDRYGQLSLNVLLTHLETFQANDVPGSPLLEFTGSIGGFGAALPEWKGLTTVTYSLGPVDLTARWRYIGAMQDVSLVGAPAGSTASNAPTVNYFDVIGRWKLNDTFELRAGVNNVTDKQPPFITTSPQANTDPSTYDVYGRRWFAAIKARF